MNNEAHYAVVDEDTCRTFWWVPFASSVTLKTQLQHLAMASLFVRRNSRRPCTTGHGKLRAGPIIVAGTIHIIGTTVRTHLDSETTSRGTTVVFKSPKIPLLKANLPRWMQRSPIGVFIEAAKTSRSRSVAHSSHKVARRAPTITPRSFSTTPNVQCRAHPKTTARLVSFRCVIKPGPNSAMTVQHIARRTKGSYGASSVSNERRVNQLRRDDLGGLSVCTSNM